MNWVLAVCALGLGVLLMPAGAMPRVPSVDVPSVVDPNLVKVATSFQRKLGRRACRARYGKRLAYVTFSGNRYVCHFRKSDRFLTKQADRKCRRDGYRRSRIISIRIKGNRSITRFVCTRR